MKQTAVEWLVEQLKKSLPSVYNGEFNKEIEQAKEMEKQQIIDACNKMQIIRDVDFDGNVTFCFDPKQYYSETFNK
jgi:hypothetical protein